MNTREYMTEIEELAEMIIEQAKDEASKDNDKAEGIRMFTREQIEDAIHDHWLHETIDGHQWVIYYSYNDDVIKHSDNSDAWEDIYSSEDMGELVKNQGMDSARTAQAFWAMYQDVSDKIYEELKQYD